MKYITYLFSFLCLAFAISLAYSSYAYTQEDASVAKSVDSLAVGEKDASVDSAVSATSVDSAASVAPVVAGEENEAPQAAAINDEQDKKWTNIVYFTGIGCPHCARTDPIVLKERLRKGDVMVFEYEIYRDNVNGPLLMEYNKAYGSKLAVPQVIVSTDKSGIVAGDAPVLKSLDTLIKLHEGNGIVLSNKQVSFDDLSFVKLPYKPKIWFKDRLAIREESSSLQNDNIKNFLLDGVVPEKCTPQKKAQAPLSGGKVKFNNACSFDGWVLMYD